MIKSLCAAVLSASVLAPVYVYAYEPGKGAPAPTLLDLPIGAQGVLSASIGATGSTTANISLIRYVTAPMADAEIKAVDPPGFAIASVVTASAGIGIVYQTPEFYPAPAIKVSASLIAVPGWIT